MFTQTTLLQAINPKLHFIFKQHYTQQVCQVWSLALCGDVTLHLYKTINMDNTKR